MEEYILKAEGVFKSYAEGDEKLEVLKGVDLTLKKGEIACLMGESGSGKTTLLNLLGSLDRPDSGLINYKGTEITQLKANDLAAFRNASIGFLFQFHYLLADFTALENIIIPGLIEGKKRPDLVRKATGLIEQVGLAGRAGHCPSELSGGEQQRVAMLRAIINDPAVVLADEPCGNLDEKNSVKLLDLIFAIAKERNQTFLIATHSQNMAKRCGKVFYLSNGKVTVQT